MTPRGVVAVPLEEEHGRGEHPATCGGAAHEHPRERRGERPAYAHAEHHHTRTPRPTSVRLRISWSVLRHHPTPQPFYKIC